MLGRKDCRELLLAADAARAADDAELASDLAGACPKAQLDTLIADASPSQALLLCGRSAAAGHRACDARAVADLEARLQPHLTLGHSDEQIAIDPLIALALEMAGKELNISWNGSDPDVVVGKLNVSIEHVTTRTVATVPDAMGNQKHVPATQHRFVAKAACQVELGDKTRVVRAQDEARDLTWQALPHFQIAPKPDPQVPPEQELKKRAALAWLRTLQKALAMNPPETVDVDDEKGCVAYGLALNLTAGDDTAAARGDGDPDRIAACEKLLGEPPGAGIPVP
ncbi:MAG TPA: hypothetical protein VGH20_17430, partial [Myxococcales bacterium]